MKLQPLSVDTPIGTLVLVVEDDHTITLTRTRSMPWEPPALAQRPQGDRSVVKLDDRPGGYLLSRCFAPPDS
jgi:hypothetical protein